MQSIAQFHVQALALAAPDGHNARRLVTIPGYRLEATGTHGLGAAATGPHVEPATDRPTTRLDMLGEAS